MMRRFTVLFVAVVVSVAVCVPLVSAGAPSTPKLVVILVVDQMRADYVDRFRHQWTGGLRRLMDEGAWFRQASYPYMTTATCVGHSTIVTGAMPRTHGIVANSWWDRESARTVGCVGDPSVSLVSYGAPVKGGASTRNLLVPALPDELRLQLGTAPRIVVASMKEYAATTMAGRRADAVVWFNSAAGALTTSSAFANAPVPFVADFVKAHPIDADFGKTWDKLLPETSYLYADEGQGEAPPARWTRTFPHVLRGASDAPDADFYSVWEESPFSDAYLGRFAEVAIDALKLGQGASTDYLAVSFTALDLVGHDFGPRSHEVQDVLARLDRVVGSLLAHLDKRVGRQNYVLALAGDHGVAPLPEQAIELGLPGGRVLTADLTARIEKALEPILGPGKKVARIGYNDIYFEAGVYQQLKANPKAMQVVMDAVRSMPGVARVFRSDELDHPFVGADDPIERAVGAGFFAPRSGDLILVLRPYYMLGSGGSTGTTHGSPYPYDQRVPVFLLGRGIRPGQYLTPSTPADIAPTLAFLSGITLAAADGRVLAEALSAPGHPTGVPAPPAKK